MYELIAGFAAKLNWQLCEANVIVEGSSDVKILWVAASLYFERYAIPILGGDMAVLAAGRGNEGGVDGLNRRLNAARQLADADRGPNGELRYHFIGLYDNDSAGRLAVNNVCSFDRRLRLCGDVFLLHPVMPVADGADYVQLQRRFEAANAPFRGLDCEIEDLLSERLLMEFEDKEPAAIRHDVQVGGRKHREFTREGKAALLEFVARTARLEDMMEVVRLIRALRDYHRLKSSHIEC